MKAGPDYKEMTPAQERVQLFKHGTRPATLTPANILQTAKNDLRAKAFNADLSAKRKDIMISAAAKRELGPTRKYGFVAKHVSQASTPVELIKAAISDQDAGMKSSNVNTVMIYDDLSTLKSALAFAELEE